MNWDYRTTPAEPRPLSCPRGTDDDSPTSPCTLGFVQQPPIVIVGSSGHARVVLDIVLRQGTYTPIGFIDSFKTKEETVFGLPVLGSEADLPALVEEKGIAGILVAIGDNSVRARVTDKIAQVTPNLAFVSAIHPTAAIGTDSTIGPGSVVMAGAIVNPGTSIARGCIVNTKASIDHDSTMEEFASLAPGVTTGGNVTVGAFTAVGIGASLFHGTTLGEHVVIGGGAVVTRPIPPFSVAYGVPAKVVRTRQAGEKYLS